MNSSQGVLLRDSKPELKQCFQLLDPKNTGFLSWTNTLVILNAYGRFPTMEQTELLQKHYTTHGNVTVKNLYKIFAEMMEMQTPTDEVMIQEAFSVYDYSNPNYIMAKDLFHIITRVGGNSRLTTQEATELISEIGVDSKGRLKKSRIW
ncbi:calmodulin [Planoprotostelium fungivorum]|uniref:Calmodulin n=1 Tax=Planoprotostelium fungivorum TaxID=1890364 RepID=A0A2P6N6Q2_9EUKA|nr:calmodulin [Planoprotostelium fungivorum]